MHIRIEPLSVGGAHECTKIGIKNKSGYRVYWHKVLNVLIDVKILMDSARLLMLRRRGVFSLSFVGGGWTLIDLPPLNRLCHDEGGSNLGTRRFTV